MIIPNSQSEAQLKVTVSLKILLQMSYKEIITLNFLGAKMNRKNVKMARSSVGIRTLVGPSGYVRVKE